METTDEGGGGGCLAYEPEPSLAQAEWAEALFQYVHGGLTEAEAGLVILTDPDCGTEVVHRSGFVASLPCHPRPDVLTCAVSPGLRREKSNHCTSAECAGPQTEACDV